MRHKTPPWIFEEPPTLAELERERRRCRLHEIVYIAASVVLGMWIMYLLLTN